MKESKETKIMDRKKLSTNVEGRGCTIYNSTRKIKRIQGHGHTKIPNTREINEAGVVHTRNS